MAILVSPTIELGGAALATAWQAALLEARAELVVSRPGRLTLRFLDPGYALLAKGMIKLGTAASLTIPGGSTPLFAGEVTEVGCDQREGEQPELLIIAHDQSHRLGRMSGVTTYLNSGVETVVGMLADAAGLTASVSGKLPKIDYLLQVDTNLGLLNELATRTGSSWWVKDKVLHFSTPTAGTSVKLGLGTTLRSFSVRASGYHADAVTVDGWNRDEQQIVTGQASSPTKAVLASSTLADIAADPGSAYGSATILTSSVGAKTQEEAATLSQVLLDRQAAASVEAWGVLDGSVSLGLLDTAEVADAGPLSGQYPVTSVDFAYRPHRGSLLRFRCGDRWRGQTNFLGGGGGANGSIVSHPGLIVGQVTNINDPNNQGRVKVRFPGLSSKDESAWARLAGIGGGDNRGAVFVPEVNDEVLVAFENGDTRLPVVIGGLYGSKAVIPTPSIANGQVQTRALQSRLGHYIKFFDGTTSATQAIELVLSGGQNLIHLGKDKLALTVPSNTPFELTVGSATVSISGSGAISVKGPSISLEANQSLELKGATISIAATGSLSVQSDGSTQIKGSQVQVQSSGPAAIVGTPVQIN
jgi:phage baseplate assembly protein gpV